MSKGNNFKTNSKKNSQIVGEQSWIKKNYSNINKIFIGICAISTIITTILYKMHINLSALYFNYWTVFLIVWDFLFYFASKIKKHFNWMLFIIYASPIVAFIFAQQIIKPFYNLMNQNETQSVETTLKSFGNDIASKIDAMLRDESDIKKYIQGRQQFDSLYDKKLKHVDSVQEKLEANHSFAKQISNFQYPNWQREFPFGYAIFSISLDHKLRIYPGLVRESNNVKIDWGSLQLQSISDKEITLVAPTMTVQGNKYLKNTVGIERGYENLNKVYIPFQVNTINIAVGIITDNQNGIIGIFGLAPNGTELENKPIIDRKALK